MDEVVVVVLIPDEVEVGLPEVEVVEDDAVTTAPGTLFKKAGSGRPWLPDMIIEVSEPRLRPTLVYIRLLQHISTSRA